MEKIKYVKTTTVVIESGHKHPLKIPYIFGTDGLVFIKNRKEKQQVISKDQLKRSRKAIVRD